MHHVYLLRSESSPKQTDIGLTSDLAARLIKHNTSGTGHTAKFRPCKLVCSSSFSTREKASPFERYLKTGSSRAFANRHFWQPSKSPGQGI